MKYLSYYENYMAQAVKMDIELNKALELADRLEQEIRDNFPYIIDIMYLYQDVHICNDDDTINLNLEFHPIKSEVNVSNDIKYDLVTLIDYLIANYNELNKSLIISGEDKIYNHNINNALDISNIEDIYSFEINIRIKVEDKPGLMTKVKKLLQKKE